MKKILLKNGEVGTVSGVLEKDVLIEGGKISGFLDRGTDVGADEEINCMGKLILPGLIDAHVHFREPGAAYKEDWETGSKAAVSGGVTTVFDMPNNEPPVLTVKDLEAKRELINGRSYVNYGLFIGYDGKNLDEVNKAKGIPGVKLYLAHSTGEMGVSDGVRDLFEKGNKLIVAHAEDQACIDENIDGYLAEFDGREVDPAVHSKIRAPECAVASVKFLCELAKEMGHSLHIAHVSTEGELDVINEYREFGVTCEVSPHHLLLSEDDYDHLGNFMKVNPPVRERSDVFAMWKGVKFGKIDIVATDHAPHAIVEKEQGYREASSGVPGVETMLPILLNSVNDEGLEVAELVRLCCGRPAEIFGVKGKGRLEADYDADIVVVDMDIKKKVKNEKLFTKCGWSPYDGMLFKGWPVMTFVGGELVFKDGEFLGNKAGKEVKFY